MPRSPGHTTMATSGSRSISRPPIRCPGSSGSTPASVRLDTASPASSSRGDELEDAGRGQVLVVDPHPEGGQRVLDGVHDRGRRDDHAAFADAAEVDVGVERHGLEVLDLDAGNVAGGRYQVVHERSRLEAAVFGVRRPLEQDRADALRHAAPDLALDDGGVDERAAVLDGDVALYLHDARLGID